jgi:rieske iron-sulfur protein
MRAMPDPDCSRCASGGSQSADRRTLLRRAAGLVLAWLVPARVHGQEADAEARARPAPGDLLAKVGDGARTPLTPGDVAAGAAPVMAWPMTADARVARSGSRLNRVLLVRLEPTALNEATRARAVDGVVAFSAICTHTGCEVGEYLADEQQLYCECHQSKFDPRDGAKVTDGPAPRPLPALPLKVEDGRLVVAAPFTTRPGFEQG